MRCIRILGERKKIYVYIMKASSVIVVLVLMVVIAAIGVSIGRAVVSFKEDRRYEQIMRMIGNERRAGNKNILYSIPHET